MDIHKKYKPYTIPNHKQFLENKTSRALHPTSLALGELDHEPFAEIEINQSHTGRDIVTVPPAQAVNRVVDEKRTLFYAMYQIARNDSSFYTGHSKVFYQQALFMKDFEDDYAKQAPFSSYFPYYQLMNYEQLRTYFTWRTQVRKGNITDTSVSFAFLYIYELLNNIGVTDSQDGLDKLMTFWQAFRVYNTVIDLYVLQWIKDYHVYYPLQQSFQEFISDHHLQMHYPTVFGYESGRHDSFDLFAGISKYDIKKSVFYGEQTQQMIHDCFYFILNRFRELFKEKNKCFEDFVFYPLSKESTWTPFSRALFYPAVNQSDRQVAISERETYTCYNNSWIYKTVILTEHGKQLIGYIMKEMEANLRKITRFKYKLSANMYLCDSEILKKFKAMEISLPQLIQVSVSEFYALLTRKIITVDIGNLKQIRKEALNTQEKLIVPENMDIDEKKSKQKETIIVPPASDIWTRFMGTLIQTEFKALKIILQEQNVKGFAAQKGIMLEVLVDGINQKAIDCVGDTILELDDTVIVYDEYREKLTEIVRC